MVFAVTSSLLLRRLWLFRRRVDHISLGRFAARVRPEARGAQAELPAFHRRIDLVSAGIDVRHRAALLAMAWRPMERIHVRIHPRPVMPR